MYSGDSTADGVGEWSQESGREDVDKRQGNSEREHSEREHSERERSEREHRERAQ